MATARKLSRLAAHRQQLHRNLLTSLMLNGRIVTTQAKAKSVLPMAEKLISLAKSGTLADRRQAATFLTTSAAVVKLGEIAKASKTASGSIKLIRTAPRVGDNAPQCALIIKAEKAAEVATDKKSDVKPTTKKPAATKKAETAATTKEAK